MDKFTNPELLKAMSISDRLINSIMVTILGMGITFLVLILLMFTIKGLSAFANAVNNKNKKSEPVKSVEPAKEVVSSVKEEDDSELVAVLSAAIMASTGNATKIIVRSYREVGDSLSSWTKVGVEKMMKN